MQHSYASGSSTVPLLGETIGENLRRTAERNPEGEALVVRAQNFRATWREFLELTGRAARGLIALGVKKGDRVALWAPNRWEWVVVQFAAARVGAILVNLNPAYKTSELEYALRQSGASLLFLAASYRGSDYVAMVEQIRPRMPTLRDTVVLDDQFDAFLGAGAFVGAETLAAREAEIQFDDPVNIQYTSGTTGFPKGATLSHHNVLNNGYFVGRTCGYTEADRVCIPVPFYHCFGMVMGNLACVSNGACMVIPGPIFDAAETLAVAVEERCTSLYGVPTMFIAMLERPDLDRFDFSLLRKGIMAGSSCPVEVMRAVQARLGLREVTICYGMTETSPVSLQTATDDPLEKRVATVGRVHPHLEVKIVDPATGALVPRGAIGELCTRGYSVMLGYWENDGATAAAVDRAGWMHTGDLATMDEEGYVQVVGRSKDMIIRGGENIYPREIEEFLHTHPDVAEAHVIGIPSERYGEEVMAWVRPRPGRTLDPATLQAYCKEHIAYFKVPRYWKIASEFPTTVTGKVQKFRMREIAIGELETS